MVIHGDDHSGDIQTSMEFYWFPAREKYTHGGIAALQNDQMQLARFIGIITGQSGILISKQYFEVRQFDYIPVVLGLARKHHAADTSQVLWHSSDGYYGYCLSLNDIVYIKFGLYSHRKQRSSGFLLPHVLS